MNTDEAIALFLKTRLSRQLTYNTLQGYEWALGKLRELYPDTLPVETYQIHDLFLHNSDYAPASLHGMWRKLRTFYIWLEEEGIGPNVMRRIPAPPLKDRLPRSFSHEEVQRLLSSAGSSRDYAILITLLDTGMRVGELASIRRHSFTPLGVMVSGKTGDRIIPVSVPILQLLKQQGHGDAVWKANNGKKGPMTSSGLQQVVRRTMIKAGFEIPKIGPHTLRHTFAVQYLMNGGDYSSLQTILGHRKVQTTMIYAAMSIDLVAQQHHRFSPMAEIPTSRKHLRSLSA